MLLGKPFMQRYAAVMSFETDEVYLLRDKDGEYFASPTIAEWALTPGTITVDAIQQ